MASSWLLTAALLLSATPDVDWTGFRNGGASIAAQSQLPVTWSAASGIAWQKELPGYGQSTPVTWRGVVYIAAVEGPKKEKGLLVALDARTGAERWRVGVDCSSGLPSNYMAARAAPTPVVDSRGVYGFFEGGDIVAATHGGELLWRRSLVKEYGEFDNHHGLGSSPAQSDDAVFLHIQHRGPSYLLCLDKQTGKTRWKVERKSTMSWSTPIVAQVGGKPLVIVSAGGEADAYDVASGERIWTLGEMAGNATPSPLFDGQRLFLGAALSDFETASNVAQSNVCLVWEKDRFQVAWRASRAMCDYASPVVCGQFVYYVNRIGVVYCLDRDSGRELFTQRLPGPCWATPIVQGERVYFFGKGGEATVIRASAKWDQLSQNSLWDPENPPKPESYVEAPGGHSHGPPGDVNGKGASSGKGSAGGPGGPGGMAAMILANDKNKDGKVDAAELPESMKRLLKAGDANQDGALDAAEIAKLGEDFRKRREGMQQQSRDPILYGVAAAGDAFFVRTGTRLYCLRDSASPAAGGGR